MPTFERVLLGNKLLPEQRYVLSLKLTCKPFYCTNVQQKPKLNPSKLTWFKNYAFSVFAKMNNALIYVNLDSSMLIWINLCQFMYIHLNLPESKSSCKMQYLLNEIFISLTWICNTYFYVYQFCILKLQKTKHKKGRT